MPVESAADRAVFTSPNDFGDVGSYVTGGGQKDIAGIYDDPSTSTLLNEAVSLDTRPTFLCAESDLPADADADAETDRLRLAGKGVFLVTAIEPDGQGMALLRLGAVD